MIGYFLNEGPVTNFEEANQSDLEMFSQMYREMAKEGVFYHLLNSRDFPFYCPYRSGYRKTLAAFDTALSRIV